MKKNIISTLLCFCVLLVSTFSNATIANAYSNIESNTMLREASSSKSGSSWVNLEYSEGSTLARVEFTIDSYGYGKVTVSNYSLAEDIMDVYSCTYTDLGNDKYEVRGKVEIRLDCDGKYKSYESQFSTTIKVR